MFASLCSRLIIHRNYNVVGFRETGRKAFGLCVILSGSWPAEVFALRWSNVLLNEYGTGLIQITERKSKAARRLLPATPRVHDLLLARHKAVGRPDDGWVFPAPSDHGKHISDGLTKFQHRKALEESNVWISCPTTLRHTALKRLEKLPRGMCSYLLGLRAIARLATRRVMCIRQADAINRLFVA